MARYMCGFTSGTGSTTLPYMSVYSAAAVGFALREAGLFQNVATAQSAGLVRLASTGTQGAGQTEAKYDPDSNTSQCQAFQTHTVAPTLGDNLAYRAKLPAVIGAGAIFTMTGTGILCPVVATNGIGILCLVATAGALDCYMVWDE